MSLYTVKYKSYSVIGVCANQYLYGCLYTFRILINYVFIEKKAPSAPPIHDIWVTDLFRVWFTFGVVA